MKTGLTKRELLLIFTALDRLLERAADGPTEVYDPHEDEDHEAARADEVLALRQRIAGTYNRRPKHEYA